MAGMPWIKICARASPVREILVRRGRFTKLAIAL
jgi:hypothetical protein